MAKCGSFCVWNHLETRNHYSSNVHSLYLFLYNNSQIAQFLTSLMCLMGLVQQWVYPKSCPRLAIDFGLNYEDLSSNIFLFMSDFKNLSFTGEKLQILFSIQKPTSKTHILKFQFSTSKSIYSLWHWKCISVEDFNSSKLVGNNWGDLVFVEKKTLQIKWHCIKRIKFGR